MFTIRRQPMLDTAGSIYCNIMDIQCTVNDMERVMDVLDALKDLDIESQLLPWAMWVCTSLPRCV
jgi:hypothetical protein